MGIKRYDKTNGNSHHEFHAVQTAGKPNPDQDQCSPGKNKTTHDILIVFVYKTLLAFRGCVCTYYATWQVLCKNKCYNCSIYINQLMIYARKGGFSKFLKSTA